VFSFGIVLCELITGRAPSSNFLVRKPQTYFSIDEDEIHEELILGM
jgi:hypothetical protein